MKKFEKVVEKYVEKVKSGELTSTGICLAIVCVFLVGVLLGIFISPKKNRVLGSYNGSFNEGNSSHIEGEKN